MTRANWKNIALALPPVQRRRDHDPDGYWSFQCYANELTRLNRVWRIAAQIKNYSGDFTIRDGKSSVHVLLAPRLQSSDLAMLRVLYRCGANDHWVDIGRGELGALLAGTPSPLTIERRLRKQRVLRIGPKGYRMNGAYFEGSTRCVPVPLPLLRDADPDLGLWWPLEPEECGYCGQSAHAYGWCPHPIKDPASGEVFQAPESDIAL